jgi:hypothetical protein
MSGADEPDDIRPAWPAGPEPDLRPFRPAEAKGARGRRAPAARAAAVPEAPIESAPQPPADDLSLDILEHLGVLSELVTATNEGSRNQVKTLIAKVDALNTAIEGLTAELRGVRRARGALSQDEVEAVAGLVVDKLQASFRVVSPGRGTS